MRKNKAEQPKEPKGKRIRAALRYYYLCRKSTREISVLLGCDERSVRRWVYWE